MSNKLKKCLSFAVTLGITMLVLFTFAIAEGNESLASSLILDQASITVLKGKTATLKAEVEPKKAKSQKLEWLSTDESVATVSNGKIQGKANGQCDIVCKTTDGSGLQSICHVEVKTSVKSITIQEKSISVLVGSTPEKASAQLRYEVMPEDASWKDVAWSSSDATVAKVDENGVVTGLKAGKTTITITSSEPNSKQKAKVQITVNQATEEIKLDKDVVSIPVKKTAKIKAELLPSNVSVKKVEWSSENENIASISNAGVITGKGVGTTFIYANAADGSGAQAKVAVTVVQPVKKITVDKNVSLPPSLSRKLDYTVTPEDATNKTVQWSSSNESVATVAEDGTVQGVAPGTCTITALAKDGSQVKAQVKVTVKEFDVVFTNAREKSVSFDTEDGMIGAYIAIGSYVMGDFDQTIVTYKNGCVESAGAKSLKPVKEGEDIVTVTVKHNGKKVISKETYTVYVDADVFKEKGPIETDAEYQELSKESLEAAASTRDEILFRNVSWGTSFTESERKLTLNKSYKPKLEDAGYYKYCIQKTSGKSFVISLFGHEAEELRYMFAKAITKDNTIRQHSSVFYLAEYTLRDDEEYTISQDIEENLKNTYGNPDGQSEFYKGKELIWYGKNDTKLCYRLESDTITVTYEWLEGARLQLKDYELYAAEQEGKK